MTFQKWPSIEQFRNVVKGVSMQASYVGRDENNEPIYDGTRPKPSVSFTGTVKIHGTNAGIVLCEDGTVEAQSRERTLSFTSDNSGFFAWVKSLPDEVIKALFPDGPGVVFGEWAGRGINNGCAVHQLDRFFAIFGRKKGDEFVRLGDVLEFPEHRIFDIRRFGVYHTIINFDSEVEVATATQVLSDLTLAVEDKCPVGSHFGVEGIGEGIVWTSDEGPFHIFKVKGEKHSTSKVRTLVPKDVEKAASMEAFVEAVVTQNRLEQGLQVMRENGIAIERKTVGEYIRWVVNDVFKEEEDTMIASGLDPKATGRPISDKARRFYFAQPGLT
jgi:hypothetical protein